MRSTRAQLTFLACEQRIHDFDLVLVLHDGRIVEWGQPGDLVANATPGTPGLAALLASLRA